MVEAVRAFILTLVNNSLANSEPSQTANVELLRNYLTA